MKKNIIQDIVPRGKRTVAQTAVKPEERDVSPVLNENPVPETSYDTSPQLTYRIPDDNFVDIDENRSLVKKIFSNWILWCVVAVSAIVLVVAVENYFSFVSVTITPKSKKIIVDEVLTAKPESASAIGLTYKQFSLIKEKQIAVPADGEKQVEQRASGTIIVYNNYSSSVQRLVKGTRFETPDGLIYRAKDSLTIPGRHIVNGKTIPGSTEVVVMSDATGEEYNIGLTDFTVPGFKSNPERFKTFYARSKTTMTGGKIGKTPSLSDKKLNEAKKQLGADLLSEAISGARASAPVGYILYDGAYKVQYEVLPPALNISDKSTPDKSVKLRERASLTVYFFKESEIAKALAEQDDRLADEVKDVSLFAPDAHKLSFELLNKTNSAGAVVGPISFKLKGSTVIVWQLDTNKLKSELAGKKEGEISEVIKKYPAIVKSESVFRPIWRKSVPDSLEQIEIKIVQPE